MKFRALDSFRGVAALMVAYFHTVFIFADRPAILANAAMFVDFFFILSGFVMTHAYRDRIAAGLAFGEYFALRLGRLLPLHVVVMLAWVPFVYSCQNCVALSGAFIATHTAETFATNLFLLNSFGLLPFLSWNYPSWSIGAELIAYIVFFVVVLSLKRRLSPIVALALAALSYLWLAGATEETLRRTYDLGALRCLGGFFLGVAIYGFHERINENWRPAALAEAATLFVVVLALGRPIETILHELAIFAAFGLVVLVFARSTGPVARSLATPMPALLGRISYSVYMLHALVIQMSFVIGIGLWDLSVLVVDPTVGQTRAFLVTAYAPILNVLALLLVVALSVLSYWFIEAPCRRAVRTMVDNQRRNRQHDHG